MKNPTVADMWAGYAAACLPANCHEVQRTETERAFYAGVVSMVELCNLIGQPGVTEERGVEILSGIEAEVAAYTERAKESIRANT